jgi:hypothetical protein
MRRDDADNLHTLIRAIIDEVCNTDGPRQDAAVFDSLLDAAFPEDDTKPFDPLGPEGGGR